MVLSLSHSLEIVTGLIMPNKHALQSFICRPFSKSHNFLFGISTSITLSLPAVIICGLNAACTVTSRVYLRLAIRPSALS
jgi:hypothetical protein